jgi:hypothetical protein
MEPIRNRLAELFSLAPLIMVLLVGILLGIVEFGIFVKMWFVVLVLAYAFWIVANYFFEIVEFKALGNNEWPVFSVDTLVAGRNGVSVVFSVLVVLGAAAYLALRYFGMDTIAWILLVAGLLLLPASVALLAVTRELSAALNPLKLVAAAVGMGGAYLYALLGAVAIFVLLRLAEARGGLWYFPLVYGLFLHAYLIGSIVYSRRVVLGVSAPRSPEALAERARVEQLAIRSGILSHAYGFSARGNRRGALKHIEVYIETEEDSLEARLWMLNEISRWEDCEVAVEFSRRLVSYCEQRGFFEDASRIRSKYEHLAARRSK